MNCRFYIQIAISALAGVLAFSSSVFADYKTIAEYGAGTPSTDNSVGVKTLTHRRYQLGVYYCSKNSFVCIGPSAGIGTLTSKITYSETDSANVEVESSFLHAVKYYQYNIDSEFYPLFSARKGASLIIDPYLLIRAHLNAYNSSAISETGIDEYDQNKNATTFSYEYGIGFEVSLFASLQMQFSLSIAKDQFPVGNDSIKISTQMLTLGLSWFDRK